MIHERFIEKIKGKVFSEEELRKSVELNKLVERVRKKVRPEVVEHFSKSNREFVYLEQLTDNYGLMLRVVKDRERDRLYYFYYFKHRIPYREYFFYKEEEKV